MSSLSMINAEYILDVIDKETIADYLQSNNYRVFTEYQLRQRDDDLIETAVESIVHLERCSDEQLMDEVSARGMFVYEYDSQVEKIVNLIYLGKPWQDEAIKHFSDISGKLL